LRRHAAGDGAPARAQGARVRPRDEPRPRRRSAPVRLVPPVAAEHVHRQAHRRRLRRRAGRDPPAPGRRGRGTEEIVRTLAAAALAAALLLAAAPAPAEVRTGTFHSAALDRDVGYAVQLPPSYAPGARPFAVVYALHGLFESSQFWVRRGLAPILDDLWARKVVPEFVVVVVDAGNTFFVNSPLGRYEDLVTQDMIAFAESTFNVR